MMDIGVITICGIAVIFVVFGLLKKLNSILSFVLAVVIAIGGTAAYVFAVPDSPISMAITEAIAQNVALDAENNKKDGEIIYEYSTNDTVAGTSSQISNAIDSALANLPSNIKIGDFLESRISKFIEAKQVTSEKLVSLRFSDAYLVVEKTDISITLKIVKGTQLATENH